MGRAGRVGSPVRVAAEDRPDHRARKVTGVHTKRDGQGEDRVSEEEAT